MRADDGCFCSRTPGVSTLILDWTLNTAILLGTGEKAEENLEQLHVCDIAGIHRRISYRTED